MRITLASLSETVPESPAVPEKLGVRMTILILMWGAVVGCGMAAMIDYGAAAGPVAQTEAQWPDSTGLSRSDGQFTLLMFVHPQCPCSRASVGELAELMAGSQNALAAQVIVLAPTGWNREQVQAEIWRTAAEIPGVTVRMDPDGIEARRFGALTSGQVLLYDEQGRLLFRGGITGARGHYGSNVGRSTVRSLIDEQQTAGAPAQCPVFGCPLFSPENE